MRKLKIPSLLRPGGMLVLLILGSLILISNPLLAEGLNNPNPSSQNSSTFLYADAPTPTPTTNYKMVLGSDFKPSNTASSGYRISGFYGINATDATTNFSASLDLPERAQITEVEAFVYHNTGLASQIRLIRADPTGTSADSTVEGTAAYVTNSLSNQTIVMNGLNVPKLDTSTSKFMLIWTPSNIGSDDILYAVRVGYTGGVARFAA